jgi:hypothetical protein
MWVAGLVVPLMLLALGVGTAVGGPPPQTGDTGTPAVESKRKRELDSLLPADSRHAFRPISKEWVKSERYVDPVLLEDYDPKDVSQEQKKRFNRQQVFSASGNKEGDYREMTYGPEGRLILIEDRVGDDTFTQIMLSNGTIQEYMHRRKGKVREAYSVSPDGSEVHRVARGSGILKTSFDKPKSYSRRAYHEGDEFFRGAYTGERLDQVWLKTGDEQLLRWRNGAVEFFSDRNRAWWGSSKGKIKLKQLDKEYDLSKLDPERVKLWEGKYAESLTSFFERYDALLKRAGHTWAGLGIEFVRKGKPFPSE